MIRMPINPTHRDIELIIYARRICPFKTKNTGSNMSLVCSLFEPLSFIARTFVVHQLRNLCGESMLDKEYSKACDGWEGVSVGFEVYEEYRRTEYSSM